MRQYCLNVQPFDWELILNMSKISMGSLLLGFLLVMNAQTASAEPAADLDLGTAVGGRGQTSVL